MVRKSITDWLNSGRTYAVGVALYDVHGHDVALKRALTQGFSDFRQARLEQALRELLKAAPPAAAAALLPVALTTNGITIASVQLPEEQVAEAEDAYRDHWLPLYQEMQALRARLHLIQDDEERGKTAHRILELERALNKIWEARDIQRKTGQAPPAEEVAGPAVITDKNALQKRLNAVRSYVSKYKRLVELRPGHAETLERYQQYCAERDQLEEGLKT